MIRTATEADVPAIVEMGRAFIAAIYPRDLSFNPDQIAQTARGLMAQPDGAVFVLEVMGAVVGMLAMIAFAHPLSGERIATELCWWVAPAHRGLGLRLLRRGERWAAERGAVILQLIAPTPSAARLYEHRGFHAVETSYQRRLA